MNQRLLILALSLPLFVLTPQTARAESQNEDYKGVSDPFGDPTHYEFAEDEREDKEFFHLGRYVMFGIDIGAGIYTGGLGSSNAPGFDIGAHLVYFFDRQIAMEAGVRYTNTLDTINPSASQFAQIDTNLIPITLAFRFYFDTKNAPKAIAIANPYLVAGGGIYIRNQSVIQNLNNALRTPSGGSNSFGGFAGAGVQFAIYRRHVYLGIDIRYHLVFWPDANDKFGGQLPDGSRGGDFVTPCLSLTYNF